MSPVALATYTLLVPYSLYANNKNTLYYARSPLLRTIRAKQAYLLEGALCLVVRGSAVFSRYR